MEAWAIQGGIRMYEYVDRKLVQHHDRKCRKILEKLRQVLREEYGIDCQISLVGSGAWDMGHATGMAPLIWITISFSRATPRNSIMI